MNKNIKDITGKRCGRLIVQRYVESIHKITRWECLCDCGNTTIVWKTSLTNGATTSCGCYKKEIDKINLDNSTHGMTNTITYKSYENMKKRCTYEKYPEFYLYGGRGIKVCDRWLESFESFFEDMGERPSRKHVLDRIDPNGNYEPVNCRWLTKKQSANNTRKTIFITYNGETKPLREWAEIYKIEPKTLWSRIKVLKWPVEKALLAPMTPTGCKSKFGE